MRAFLVYKDKTAKGFRKITNSGSGIFDKYRTQAVAFLRYTVSDLDANLAEYNKEIDLNSIRLEDVFPVKYKWLVSDVALRQSRNYLETLETRITEFEGGKEDNLKILVGYLFLRYTLLVKIVETYLSSASNIKRAGGDITKLTLEEIGITKRVLKYFDGLQDLGNKSIDDWLAMKVDPTTAKHFYSSMKRILTILMSADVR